MGIMLATTNGEPPANPRGNVAARRAAGVAPIELRALGGFSISANEFVDATVSGGAVRPVDLLKALVASGPTGAQRSELEALLWPNADRVVAESTLDSTIFRARKLLGAPEAIRVAAGIVNLSPRLVWVDAWVFQQEADSLFESLNRSSVPSAADILERESRFFDLYRGSFLSGETLPPWAVLTRDKLQSRFLRVCRSLGQYWLSTGRTDRAEIVYERALEADNLREEMYRGLMQCQLKRGEPAEALNTFRRCRELLSVVLGIAPSAETERLYQAARYGNSAP